MAKNFFLTPQMIGFVFSLFVSLVFIGGVSIGIFYTNEHISYLEQHPIYYSPEKIFRPDGGIRACVVLNHTYLNDSTTGDAVIDIFANISNFTGCKPSAIVKFLTEILQSCPCHNASQINNTIDRDFPIGKPISCCVDDACSKFNTNCQPPDGSWIRNPDIDIFTFLYVCEWFAFSIALLFFAACLIYLIAKKFKSRNYKSIGDTDSGQTVT